MNVNNLYMTYADIMQPSEKNRAFLYNLVLIITGSLLLGLSAKVKIFLPFSPVPFTGQTFAVLLIGALYGSGRGMLTVFAYLLEGFSGLPVFAGGGMGFAYLAGPTGGYLIGFIAAAGITGYLAERGWDRRLITSALAMLAGSVAIYIFGLAWLWHFTGTSVLTLGFFPFIPGDVIKITAATLLLPAGWKLLDRLA